MDALFLRASELGGVAPDQLKLIFSLFVAYPLAALFTSIPASRPALRHIYNLAVSAFFLIGLLHLWSGVLQCLASSAFTYLVAYYVRAPYMPWIIFVAAMGNLTLNHTLRALSGAGYDVVDITGTQMVLTMKLTTFAWNVFDGRHQSPDLDTSQAAAKITTFPDPLAFLGYVFFFPGILVGPTFEYIYYEQLVHGTLFTPNPIADKTAQSSRLPQGRKRAAYTKFAQGAFFLGVFALWGGGMDYDRILTPEFSQKSFLGRYFFTYRLGLAQRTKYYGVWLLAEGASILTGLGFNGYAKTGETLWNRTANVDIMNIEIAPNFKILLDSWNMNTNIWLRNCVYKRVTPKGKKPGFSSSMITFLTSAFWHGIHIGYYLSFFLGGFIQYSNRLMRQYCRPLFLTPDGKSTQYKPIYDALGILASSAILGYVVAPFQLLDLKRSILAWHRLYWYGHILVALPIIFFLNGGKRVMRKVLASRGIVLPDRRKRKPGAETPLTSGAVTPGAPGAPNGVALNVPPVEMVVKEASAALQESKKDI
ncbi:endoplasmic reticulum protein [Cantharellus anzutake]|uniref:endoplasmic reticulum protein n=1 Tax=Cantharellus anzutake TaxID=1750568 RepID=UPI00190772BD|nr:endoplasmic reticulum protein [Cantharellus anzutake]KAF8341485.1 endoplasmic reticulum protein [Cantharellus anzutake]